MSALSAVVAEMIGHKRTLRMPGLNDRLGSEADLVGAVSFPRNSAPNGTVAYQDSWASKMGKKTDRT